MVDPALFLSSPLPKQWHLISNPNWFASTQLFSVVVTLYSSPSKLFLHGQPHFSPIQLAPAPSFGLISKAKFQLPAPAGTCLWLPATLSTNSLWRTASFLIALHHFSRVSLLFLANLITGEGNSLGAGIIPLSKSLLEKQVPSPFLSLTFLLAFFVLSHVLSSFVIFFLPYHNLEVFCHFFANFLCEQFHMQLYFQCICGSR